MRQQNNDWLLIIAFIIFAIVVVAVNGLSNRSAMYVS